MRPINSPNPANRHFRYVARLQLGLVTVLLLLLLAVHRWPSMGPKENRTVTYSAPHTVFMEEIVQSRQRRSTPPPPAPLPPVIVPKDHLPEEHLILDDPFPILEDPGDNPEPLPAAREAPVFETAPKPVRIVEPEYPRAARRRRIQAEVVVTVIVDIRGYVLEPGIVERYILHEGVRKPVTGLDYGLEEAALTAAARWLFRPATRNGEPVRSRHELSFRFGE